MPSKTYRPDALSQRQKREAKTGKRGVEAKKVRTCRIKKDSLEYRERVLYVRRMLSSGYTKADIKTVCEGRWDVGPQAVEGYLNVARREIVASTGKDREDHRCDMLEQIDCRLRDLSITVLEMEKLLALKAKILGLLAPLQIQGEMSFRQRHERATGILDNVAPSGRDAFLAALRQADEAKKDSNN